MLKKYLVILLLAVLSSFVPAFSANAEEIHFVYDYDEEEGEDGERSGFIVGDLSQATLSSNNIRLDGEIGEMSATVKLQGVYSELYEEVYFDSVSLETTCTNRKMYAQAILCPDNEIKIYVGVEHCRRDYKIQDAYKKYSGTVKFRLAERTFSVDFTYIPRGFKNDNIVVYPKQSKQMKIVNTSSKKVKWKSSDKKVATISKTGKLKVKKAGYTVITATYNGKEYYAMINVAADKKMAKLVNRAEYIINNWDYDQKKRGVNGYYDCSSLVWRLYNQYYGVKFGTSSYGTTYTEYPWCQKYAKKVKYNNKKQNKTPKPGDIGFYKSGNSMGHVEIFKGYNFCGFNKKGKPIVSEVWLWYEGDYHQPDKVYRVK